MRSKEGEFKIQNHSYNIEWGVGKCQLLFVYGYKKRSVKQINATLLIYEVVYKVEFLGLLGPKNHSILGVCEDFEGERNDKITFIYGFVYLLIEARANLLIVVNALDNLGEDVGN